MSDDLAKRLRKYAEPPHSNKVKDVLDIAAIEAADRIEELEAKLAKVEVIFHIIASDKWDERLGEAVDLACEYIAELKGEK
jgi:hypothetical protein